MIRFSTRFLKNDTQIVSILPHTDNLRVFLKKKKKTAATEETFSNYPFSLKRTINMLFIWCQTQRKYAFPLFFRMSVVTKTIYEKHGFI